MTFVSGPAYNPAVPFLSDYVAPAAGTRPVSARYVVPGDVIRDDETGMFHHVIRLGRYSADIVFFDCGPIKLYAHVDAPVTVMCRACTYRSGSACPAHSDDVWAWAR